MEARPSAPAEPSRILILDLGQLGDVVLSVPALAAIRARFPRAHITVAAGLAAGEAIALSGAADRVLPVDRVALRDGHMLESIAKILRLTGEVRRTRYDLVIDLRSLWETNLLGYFSGAPVRLFANRGGRSLDLLATLRVPREDHQKHLVDRYLDVLAPLGIDVSNEALRIPRLATRKEDEETAATLLRQQGYNGDRPLAGFFPGAGHASRCWPLARFAEAASRLESEDGVLPVLLLGPEEQANFQQARGSFPPGTICLSGLTLAQLASVAARLAVLISNDTGPVHVAAAVGTPVVVLLGTLHREKLAYMPVGEHHRIVARRAIEEIGVDEVCAAAHSVLAAGAISAALEKPAR